MKYFVYADETNPKAVVAAKGLISCAEHELEENDMIVVLGGDGTMIRAIHELYKLNLPFYGVNYGHLGFLLNEPPDIPTFFVEYPLHLLKVFYKNSWGSGVKMAVNDVWVERATPQTARMQVSIDNKSVLPNIYADGLLVCTPQGSTAYARAMGGTPLPLDSDTFQLVGSNVSYPTFKSAVIGSRQLIEIKPYEKNKRPINLYADGKLVAEEVTEVSIFKHPAYSVTLRFKVGLNLADKISAVQFPQ